MAEDTKPKIGAYAFLGAPPKSPLFPVDEDPEWGVDEEGDPLTYEAFLIRQRDT